MMLHSLGKALQYILPYGLVHQTQKRSGWYFQYPDPNFRLLQKQHDECIVLVNGPSVKEQWPSLYDYAQKADVLTVNWALEHEAYRELRPKAHFLVDPYHFLPANDTMHDDFIEVSQQVRSMLSKVNWPMVLYVPPHFYQKANSLGYSSKHVALACTPTRPAPKRMPQKRKYRLMDQGAYSAGAETVSLLPLYIAIASRYRKIWIAGLDMSFMNTFRVDKHCKLFFSVQHGYEAADDTGSLPLADLLRGFVRVVDGMAELYRYAKFCKIDVINISENSILDIFPKGELGKTPYPHFTQCSPQKTDD